MSVVLTGLGAVSPYGAGVKAYWAGLTAGTCAIRPATLIDTTGVRCRLAAEVPDVLPGSRRISRADRLPPPPARRGPGDPPPPPRDPPGPAPPAPGAGGRG